MSFITMTTTRNENQTHYSAVRAAAFAVYSRHSSSHEMLLLRAVFRQRANAGAFVCRKGVSLEMLGGTASMARAAGRPRGGKTMKTKLKRRTFFGAVAAGIAGLVGWKPALLPEKQCTTTTHIVEYGDWDDCKTEPPCETNET